MGICYGGILVVDNVDEFVGMEGRVIIGVYINSIYTRHDIIRYIGHIQVICGNR